MKCNLFVLIGRMCVKQGGIYMIKQFGHTQHAAKRGSSKKEREDEEKERLEDYDQVLLYTITGLQVFLSPTRK